MAESAVGIDLGTGVARRVRRAIMLMAMVSEMRCLLRFLLVLAIAGRRRKGSVQRQQHQQQQGEETSHGRRRYHKVG